MIARNAFLIGASLVALASPCRPQAVTWSAPVLGYFYDENSKSIKAVAGVSGAASIDGPVPSPVKLQSAFVAPGKRFAIVESMDQTTVLLDWSEGGASVRELPGAITSVDTVAFSRAGNVALLVSKSSGKFQVWRGLPVEPAIQQELAAYAEVVAIADDGTLAVAQSDGVYLFEGGDQKLVAPGDYSAISFRPGTRAIFAAGRFSDTIVNLRSAGTPATIATADDGVSDPVALQFTRDGSKLVVANRRSRSATVIEIATGISRSIGCDCNPTAAAPGTSNAVFRITDLSDEVVVFLDASSDDARVFMIPGTGESR